LLFSSQAADLGDTDMSDEVVKTQRDDLAKNITGLIFGPQ